MRYILKNADRPLLVFSANMQSSEADLQIEMVYEENRPFFPLNLVLTNDGVENWLKHRTIPKNRAYVNALLSKTGLSINRPLGIIAVCKGLSLNDCFWVDREDEPTTFEKVNLYDNRFSRILAAVAFTGYGSSVRTPLLSSPEFSTNGMLPKCWRRMRGKIYLYKGGTTGASNTGREPYCEYYASQIAETMGLNAVHYDLENWKGITASKCALFTDIDTAYIPAGRIVRSGGIAACLKYYDSLGSEFSEQIRSMLVFDALIYNEDRHFGNFGVLRDNHSGKVIAPAPVFDNGLSLFCYAGKEDYPHLEEYARTRSNPYNISYEEVCAEVMGSKQKKQLRRMIGFRFQRHLSLNLPEEHLEAIEKHLQIRLRRLLSIPVRRRSKLEKVR